MDQPSKPLKRLSTPAKKLVPVIRSLLRLTKGWMAADLPSAEVN
jgi:hypothetical protein